MAKSKVLLLLPPISKKWLLADAILGISEYLLIEYPLSSSSIFPVLDPLDLINAGKK